MGAALPPGFPSPDQRRFLNRHRQMLADPALEPWLMRLIVLRHGRDVVGDAGFHGPPDAEGRLELGYQVLPAHRRRGYATEAAVALIGWAHSEHGINRFVASVAPDNVASRRVVGKLGFTQTGTRMDEVDGPELVFELTL